MLTKGAARVGDIVLYNHKKKILEWEVLQISPSEQYVEIENEDYIDRWVYYSHLLEIIERDDDDIEISAVTERPPVIESKFKT